MTALARNKVKHAFLFWEMEALTPGKVTDKIVAQHRKSIDNAFDNFEDVISARARLDERLNALEKEFQAHLAQQERSKR